MDPRAHRSGIGRWWVPCLLAEVLGNAVGASLGSVVGVVVVGAALAVLARALAAARPVRPLAWQLLLGAVGMFWLATAVTAGLILLVGPITSYPSPADAANLVGYLLAVAAVVVVVRGRTRALDPTGMIDAGIVTGGVASLAWVFVLLPDLQDRTASALAVSTNVVFDVLSLVLVALVVRLALSPGVRNGAWYWLVGAVGSALASDLVLVFYSRAEAGSALVAASYGLAAWSCVCIAASAGHPDMAAVTGPVDEQVAPLNGMRLGLMIAAVLVAPVTLLVRSRGSSFEFTLGVVVTWAGMCALIVVRITGLVRAREQMAKAESIVRAAGTAMVGASGRTEMCDAARRAAHKLLGLAGEDGRVAIGLFAKEGLLLEVGEAPGSSTAPSVLHSPALLAAGASAGPTVLGADDVAALPDGLRSGWVAVFPMPSQMADQGVLVVAALSAPPPGLVGGCESVARLLALALDSAAAAALRHRRAFEKRFQRLFEHSADIVVLLGREGHPGFVSPSAGLLLGLGPEAVAALDLRQLVNPDDLARYDRLVTQASLDDERPVDLRLARSDGQWCWFDVVARDLTSVPDIGSVVITARNATDRKMAEERLARSARRFRSLVQNSSDIILIVDETGSVTWVSTSTVRVLGAEPSAFVGRQLADLVDDGTGAAVRAALRRLDDPSVDETLVEVRLRRADGDTRVFSLTLTDRRADEAVREIVCNARDITEQKALEEGLRFRALHDALTGLANRVLLRDRVEHALALRVSTTRLLALLFIDLDDFKTINDGLGHAAGDELLSQVAVRLRGCCRAEDTAARLGGDEFAVLLESSANLDEVLAVSDRLQRALGAPFQVGGRQLTVAASVGAALTDSSVSYTPDELLRNADAAMYVAKNRGKNRVEVFEPSMHMQAMDRLELKEDLVAAVARSELRLYYQPIVDLGGGAVVGFEALMRWQHPTRGLLAPMVFIPLAEETGLIVPIGHWALETAMAQGVAWRHAGHDVQLAVNLSARQLDTSEVVDDLSTLLRATGTPPSRLTVELTESLAVGPEAELRLMAMRALGVQIAADDFGTGVASYATLARFPFTYIKIDKSLIDDLTRPARGSAQVRSIIDMAHESDLIVVAEGVEHADQAAILRDLGCDQAQGFYFGRPEPPLPWAIPEGVPALPSRPGGP